MSQTVIDLTLSGDEGSPQPQRHTRTRAAPTGSDSDLQLVEPPVKVAAASAEEDDDDDVRITATVGDVRIGAADGLGVALRRSRRQVPLADYAHPRHACAIHRFASTHHAAFCAKVWLPPAARSLRHVS